MTALLLAVAVVGGVYLIARVEPTPRRRDRDRSDGGGSDASVGGYDSGGGGGDCGGDGGGGCD